MSRTLLILAAFGCCSAMWPTEDGHTRSGQGYMFLAPMSGPAAGHLGIGGEAFLYGGLAAGAEAGYAFPGGAFRAGFGVLSVNGSYHLNRNTHWRLWPFVTGGYSLGFRSGAASLANLGGGANYWVRDHLGLRLEFREYLGRAGSIRFRELRFGLAFR